LSDYSLQEDTWSPALFQYERHRPETTLLYQLVEQHWPAFREQLAAQGKSLPVYVVQGPNGSSASLPLTGPPSDREM
jgi:hypothetical protein